MPSSLTANTSKSYVYILENPYSSFLKIRTGHKLETINSWNYTLNIMRIERGNKSFENSLNVLIGKTF